LKILVVFSALSTAFRPLTLVEPPLDVPMLSQPGPSGTQLTDGTGKEGTLALSALRWAAERLSCRISGAGMACAAAFLVVADA
jgi:hypothetical protein